MLQKLIDDRVKDGKSLRRIAEESGVEYTSISNYYHRNVEPRGKNLALLAKYFRIHFAELMDDYVPADMHLSPLKKEILDALETATDEELQAVRVLLRRRDKQSVSRLRA